MQTNILKKCLEELNKAEPNISYLKGTLETLIEMSGNNPTVSPPITIIPNEITNLSQFPNTFCATKVDEVDEVLKKYETGKIGNMSQL